MSRLSRNYSESGVYHILFRGVNQQNILDRWGRTFFVNFLFDKWGRTFVVNFSVRSNINMTIRVRPLLSTVQAQQAIPIAPSAS